MNFASPDPAKPHKLVIVFGVGSALAALAIWSFFSYRANQQYDLQTKAGRRALEVQTRAHWEEAWQRAWARMNPAQQRQWMEAASNIVALEKTNSTLAYWTMASNTAVLINWMRAGGVGTPAPN
jgi:hypothetical protein